MNNFNDMNLSEGNSNILCFLENTKIFTNHGYIPIEKIKIGDFVKTLNNYKCVYGIGTKNLFHEASLDRIKDQLYVLKSKHNYDDLIITGTHSLLVDHFPSEEIKEQTQDLLGKIYLTDNMYRLPACLNPLFDVYPIAGNYPVYHIALENEDYYGNYGIWANGVLTESCSKRIVDQYLN